MQRGRSLGIGIYPTFEPPVPDANFDSDGKLLLAEFVGLDDIASAHGLMPISSFGDNRPVPEDFEGAPDELSEILGPWDAWFPIEDGLHCVEGLALILRADAAARALVRQPDEVIEELEGLSGCLRKGALTATSFRLEVG